MGYNQLTEGERYVIAALHASGETKSAIANVLGRHRSTIGREYKRNASGYDGKYRASKAQGWAVARKRKSHEGSQFSEQQWSHAERLLLEKWSPEQVVGTRTNLGPVAMSRATIYRHIREDKAGGGDLWRHMRLMAKRWRKRYRSVDFRGVLKGKRLIDDRPKAAHERSRRGHLEGDTVMGSDGKACVLTLVDRKTGMAQIVKLNGRTKENTNMAIAMAIQKFGYRIRTITFDNGTEFHGYKELEAAFPVKCYFARPYHSWERGSNESFNGLFRQYVPKGVCMKSLTQADCNSIGKALNNRPRKRYGFRSPIQVNNGSTGVLHLM
jgi:transposase, IS30 family